MKLFRFTLLLFALALPQIGFADDPLPSWKDSASKGGEDTKRKFTHAKVSACRARDGKVA